MTDSISLSVVICTYNRSHSLAETLESLNACDLPADQPVEFVVIDNNSSDNTPAVCAAFAARSRLPFRSVLETTQGLSAARNRGIQEARGNVIIFTDDDILVNASWLVIYAHEFAKQRVDCAFGRVRPDWRGPAPVWFSDVLRPPYALLDYGDERIVVTDRAYEFFGANFAVRKDLLVRMGGFDVNLGRTKDKLFIGEETRVFLDLLRNSRLIAYNPDIEVLHVIEERRKEKAYLLRYFRDTAASLVYASQEPSGRRLVGIPFYRIRELATFYLALVPRAVSYALRRKHAALFVLRLHWIRANRMVLLYLQAALERGPRTPSGGAT